MKHTNKVIFEIYFGYTTKLEGYPYLITDMNELGEMLVANIYSKYKYLKH